MLRISKELRVELWAELRAELRADRCTGRDPNETFGPPPGRARRVRGSCRARAQSHCPAWRWAPRFRRELPSGAARKHAEHHSERRPTGRLKYTNPQLDPTLRYVYTLRIYIN